MLFTEASEQDPICTISVLRNYTGLNLRRIKIFGSLEILSLSLFPYLYAHLHINAIIKHVLNCCLCKFILTSL